MEASCFTFMPGSNVEVRSVEKESKGAWFPAKILEPPAGPTLRKRKSSSNKNILVQFTTIVGVKDPKKPLVEHTTLSLLRPEPPADNSAARFEQNDVVDAFYLDTWWPGVVMDVVGEIDNVIEEMQQKRKALVIMKEIKLSEISRWQSEANDISINIQSIQCGFGKLLDGL